MNTRRSFFRKVASLVAAVAIAPEIAFRTKLALPVAGPEVVEDCIIEYKANTLGISHQLEQCSLTKAELQAPSKDDLDAFLQKIYNTPHRGGAS